MYAIKIFNSYFWDTTVNRIEEIRNIELNEYLDSFDVLTLDIDYFKDVNGVLNCSGLREMQKIQLIKADLQEKVLFEGFIYQINPTFENVSIECRDFKGLLENKVIYDDKDFIGATLEEILEELVTDLNTRSAGDTNPEAWTFEIDAPVIDITQSYNKGTTYFSLFKSLGLIVGKERTVKEGKIIFKSILGTDKTSGLNFTELLFDINAPDENNISNIQVRNYGTIRNNILTSIASVENVQSREDFGRLEVYNDLEGEELTKELAKISQKQTSHSFNVDYSRLNTDPELGDKLRVYINAGIDFLDIEGDLFITKRTIRFLGNTNVFINIEVWDITIKKTGLADKINDLQDEVKKLIIT